MISKDPQGLFASVQSGDETAAGQVYDLLWPAVTVAVRRLAAECKPATPLERRVQALLDDAGPLYTPDEPGALEWIAQAICAATVAKMQAGYGTQAALATVLA